MCIQIEKVEKKGQIDLRKQNEEKIKELKKERDAALDELRRGIRTKMANEEDTIIEKKAEEMQAYQARMDQLDALIEEAEKHEANLRNARMDKDAVKFQRQIINNLQEALYIESTRAD